MLWIFLEFSGGLEVSLANSYRTVIFKPLRTFRAFNIVVMFPEIWEGITLFCPNARFHRLVDNTKVACNNDKFAGITAMGTDKKCVCHILRFPL